MNGRGLDRWTVGIIVLAILGMAIRLGNALRYPIDMGYDAAFHWQYIALLMRGFTVPAPDAGWAMAHPPLFYWLGAGLGELLGEPPRAITIGAVRVVSSVVGLLAIASAVALVRRADPGNPPRAFIAAGLLVFLPVHVYMSAMLSEEILCASLISIAVVGMAWDTVGPESPSRSEPGSETGSESRSARRLALLGALAGLALLTKLTGVLVLLAAVLVLLVEAARSGSWRSALVPVLWLGGAGALVGGWFYVRNLIGYGYLYPYGLEAHAIMFTMPPGHRELADYVRFPLATFTDPQLLSPDLLRSVWGSTYVTIWFDGHRHFLPQSGAALSRVGTAMLVLGLVPTAAFAVGLAAGARRVWRSSRGPDAILVFLVALTLAGYVAFSWRNPWFAVLKGSFLLGLAVPFAYYGSEALARWTSSVRVVRAVAVWSALAVLAAFSTATFSYGLVFSKSEPPGIEWTPVEGR
ncbi:MAG: hypothetical protein O7G30_11315 [Proteobacteria bacterium]|nr:hypothetical protein [Pseudomonadota bacterium]